MPQLEKSKDFENRYTGVYYKFFEDDVENMSLTSDEEETLPTKVQWIDFKQQFFSSILITETPFSDVSLTSKISQKAGYLKDAYAEIPLPYNGKTDEQYHLKFFFGPNSYPPGRHAHEAAWRVLEACRSFWLLMTSFVGVDL